MKVSENLLDDLINPVPTLSHFRDIVVIAGRNKKFKLLEKLLKNVSGVSDPAILNEMKVFIELIKNFYSNDFEKAGFYLELIKKTHYLHYFDFFKYRAMIYYETSDYIKLSEQMNYFKIYLKRHSEVPDILRMKALNFIKDLLLMAAHGKKSNLEEIEYSKSGGKGRGETSRLTHQTC